MKSNRNYVVAIGALFGLLLGAFLGLSFDDVRAVRPGADLVGRFNACFYCVEALFPMLGWWVNANAVTLVGLLAGSGTGALVGWALAGNLAGVSRGAASGGTPVSALPAAASRTISGRAPAATDESLGRRLEQLSALTDPTVYETFDGERILTRVHDEALRITGAHFASVIQLDWNEPGQAQANRVGSPIDFPRFAPIEEDVLATNQSRNVADFQAEPVAPVVAGVRSALLTPIAVDDKVIGLIGLYSHNPNSFDFEAQRVVETLAAQAAVALNNARRYEEQVKWGEVLRSRADQLQHLLQVTRALQPERTLAANLETVAFGIQQHAGFNIVVIGAINPHTNQFERLAAAGLPAATIEQLKPVRQTWDFYAAFLRSEFQTGAAYYIPHDQAVELFRPFDVFDISQPAGEARPAEWRRGDVLLVPIYGSAGEAVGLIQLDDPRDGRAPNRVTVEALEMFASPAALVIENARLLAQTRDRLDETQDRASQLEALNDAVRLISSALRREDVINIALDQLKRVVAHDRATLYLKDKSTGQLRVATARGLEGTPDRPGLGAEALDRTLFAEILANRRVLAVPDVRQDARFPKSVGRRGSWLGVPLVNRSEVVGLLGLDKLELGFYTSFQAPVAQAYANQMAVALENARLYDETLDRATELTERTQRLALLRHVSAEVVGALDADRALAVMVQEMARVFGADEAAALVWGEGDEATLTRSGVAKTERVSLGTIGAEALVRRVRDALVPLTLDKEALTRQGQWAGAGISSALALPMAVRETLLGVVLIGSRDALREFSPGEIEVGETISRQAAVMVHNSQQFYKGQQRLVELASIAQVSRALIGPLELRPLYEVIRAQLVALTGATNLALGLYDESRNELSFPMAVRAGREVTLPPQVPGNISQFIIQSRLSLLLTGDRDANLRALGAPDLISHGGAWDAVEGKSYLVAPLVAGERLIGLLQIAHADQANALTTSHERILIGVAPQIAAALENAHRYEQSQLASAAIHERVIQLQEHAGHLEALTQAALVLTAAPRLAEVYAVLHQQLPRLMPYDRLTLWLRDSIDEPFYVWGEHGRAEAAAPPPGRFRDLAGPVAIADLAAQPGLSGLGTGSWLGAPLSSKGAVRGVIGLEKSEPGFYTAKHAALLETFAAQAGLAIENARQAERSLSRLQELDGRARDLSLVNHISSVLGGMLDLQGLARLGARELAAALQSDAAAVVLFDGDSLIWERYPGESPGAPIPERFLGRMRAATAAVLMPEITAVELEWLASGVQSALAMPLTADGSLIGALAVGQQSGRRDFATDSARLAGLIAGHLSAAAQRALLYQRTQRQLVELGSISQVGRAVSGTIERRKLYDIVQDRILTLTGADTLCIATYESDRADVSYPLVVLKGKTVEVESRGPTGVIRYVLRSRQPVLVTGDVEDKRLDPEVVAALGDKAAVIKGKSILAVPLTFDDRLIGVLAVADERRVRAFSTEHLRLLVSVASQVAAAVENARIFETSVTRARELEDRAQSLAAFGRTAAAFNGLVDVESVSRAAAREFAHALKADCAAVVGVQSGRTALVRYPQEKDAAAPGAAFDEEMLARLRQHRRPILLAANSDGSLKAALAHWLGAGVKSAMLVPFLNSDELIGAAAVGASQAAAFTERDLDLAGQLAGPAANALANAVQREAGLRQTEALDRQIQQLLVVNRVAAELNSSLNAERVLSIAVQALAEALRAEHAYGLAVGEGGRLAVRRSERGVVVAAPPVDGDRIVEELRETLMPTVIADVSSRAPWLGKDIGTALLVPMVASGQLVGLVGLGSTARRQYAVEEIDLAAGVAGPAAVALNNARLHEKTLKRLVDLGSITQTGRAVSGTVELKQLYDTVRAQVGSLVGARSMTLALYDETKNEVSFPVLLRNGQVENSSPRAPGAVLWHIIQTQQPLRFSTDAERQARERGFSLSENGASNGVYGKSYLGVPLISGNKTIGVLSVADPDTDGAFDAEHERALVMLATQIAPAIDNARIYESAALRVQQLEERLQILTVSNRAWEAMARSLDTPAILETTLQEGRQALNCDLAAAWWWDDNAAIGSTSPAGASRGSGQRPAAGDPLVQWLEDNLGPLAVDDLALDPLTKSADLAWLGEQAKSAVIVPLTVTGKLTGLLAFASTTSRHFGAFESGLAAALGSQAATALHTAWQYGKTQRNLNEAARIVNISRALNRVANLNQLWVALQGQVTALTGAETLALQLYDESTGEVAVPVLVQNGAVSSSQPRAPGALTRHILLSRQPLLLNGDLKKQAEGMGIMLTGAGLGEVVAGRSFAGVPLLIGDRVTGVLVVAADKPDTLSESHLALLASAASPVATAVENARTFARTRGELAREQDRTEHARQATQDLSQQLRDALHELAGLRQQQAGYQRRESLLQLLIRVTHTLTGLTDVDEAFRRVLAITGEALGAELGAIYEIESQSGILACRATFEPAGSRPPVPAAMRPDQGLPGAIYQSQQAAVIHDLENDERWNSMPLVADSDFRCAVAAPMTAGGRTTGAVIFLSSGNGAFDNEDLTFVEAVAREMALAKQNVYLTTAQERLAVEQAISSDTQRELERLPAALATAAGELPAGPEGERTGAHATGPALPGTASEPTLTDSARADLGNTRPAARKRVPEPLAEFDVSADDLQEVPDAAPPSLARAFNPMVVVGLVAVFVVGGLALTLALTGAFGRIFGAAAPEPTAITIIVTDTALASLIPSAAPAVATAAVAATEVPTQTSETTFAPTQTEALTETATGIPTATVSPTPGPTLPPGVVALGTIQVTPGTSARLRASPNGDVVGSVADDEQVQILQGQEISGGVTWIQIRLKTGQVGWIADSLVETTTAP